MNFFRIPKNLFMDTLKKKGFRIRPKILALTSFFIMNKLYIDFYNYRCLSKK